jgi:PAS domain S-box-containing protein
MSRFERDIRPLLGPLRGAMLGGHGHSAPAHDMASDTPSHIRPSSRPPASGVDRELAPPVAGLAALGAAGVALSLAAAWMAATGAGPEPRGFSAAAHALVIVAPLAAGLYAVYRHPGGRFGRLLVLASFLWSPTMLAEASNSVLYSVGRIWVWFAELMLIYLVLAFPSGRLASRVDRLLVRAAAIVVSLYLVVAVLGEYPEPSPWASCGTDCPPNAFMLPSSEPGFVDAVLMPIVQTASTFVFAGVALQLLRRLVSGSSLMRVELVPVLAAAVVRMVATDAFLVARAANPDSPVTEVLGWLALLATPAVSAGFLIGLVRSRARAGRALARLSGAVGRPSAQQLQKVIAEAVDDPSLEVVYRTSGDPAEWVDDRGRPATLPEALGDRAATEIRSGGVPVAALIHDPALADAPVMTEVANGFAQMALQNQRLETELRASMSELKASRSRIMSAADEERRRIERDLHDGAQQRLLALAIELELAGELVGSDPGKGARRLHELVQDVNEAMNDIRSLAHGLYPSILVERGLVEALWDAAAACPLRTTLSTEGLGRYAPEIEGAVYFCCREALQNAAKHAEGARSATITLWKAEQLHFEVRDDGAGLPADRAHASEGAGLTNMRDRIGAIGGTLAVESHPGEGTRVMGAVPVSTLGLPPPIDSLLRQATDALPDCFAIYRAVVDARGNVIDFAVEHMNDAARRNLGVGPTGPIGKTLGQLQPDYLRSRAFRWLRHIVELEVPGGREDNAYEAIAGDRRRLLQSSELRAAPLGDGRVVVVWRDVTEHARVDEELRLQSTGLRLAAEGVCLVRASDGVIVYANHRFTEIMGYEDGELDGRPVAEINWEDEPGQSQLVADQISADLERFGEGRCELRNRRKDGSLIWCEAHVVAFDHPDHGKVWVSVQHDVTSRRETQTRSSHGNGRGLGARWER